MTAIRHPQRKRTRSTLSMVLGSEHGIPNEMMDLPPTSLVMIGSIGAAMITGLFSYVNLIGTKEQNISKIRADWIQGLTGSLAVLFSEVELLLRLVESEVRGKSNGLDAKELGVFRNTHKDEYRRLNEAFCLVRLRLDGTRHAAILELVNKLHQEFYGSCTNLAELTELQETLTSKTQILGQEVWTQIKTGDAQFRHLKTAIIVMLVTAVLAGGVLIAGHILKNQAAKTNDSNSPALQKSNAP